jgi:uncharacterized protein YktB (UPF0637 family)
MVNFNNADTYSKVRHFQIGLKGKTVFQTLTISIEKLYKKTYMVLEIESF